MNPGKFKDRIKILKLNHSDNVYTWDEEIEIWAKAEQQKGTNIFSKVGLGAKSVKFTIRKRDITLHNAIKWQGKHCFLTDIMDTGRGYIEVTAALVEPRICTVERTGEPTLNELNRQVFGDPVMLTFPGCLTEKYIHHIQNKPISTVETWYVLVTPKVIELKEGELVTIDNTAYEVKVSHTLDEYKNEYEISARREA